MFYVIILNIELMCRFVQNRIQIWLGPARSEYRTGDAGVDCSVADECEPPLRRQLIDVRRPM